VTSTITASILFLILWTVSIEAREKSPASLPRRPSTWYEFMLRQFNKSDFNYGGWIEERRRILLDATARSPYFWYSFTMTAICMLLSAVYAKHHCDNRKIIRVACEFLADIHNDDLLAREQAETMTAKYNRHIEACNRAIEAAENEGWKQSSNPELEEAKNEIARLRQLLDEKISEHKRVSDELREKSNTLAQLSLRVDTLSKRLKGAPVVDQSKSQRDTNQELVSRINTLEQQLRQEQEKNKRLKG
jgi:cell fate (sporulation/competence/biofilm development) regulator YmcA (YheA/YmcA/DUF963 family)